MSSSFDAADQECRQREQEVVRAEQEATEPEIAIEAAHETACSQERPSGCVAESGCDPGWRRRMSGPAR